MARFPKKAWQEFHPSLIDGVKRIAMEAAPPMRDGVRRGPHDDKRAAWIYRGEFYRFRETLRIDATRRADATSYPNRLFSIINDLTATVTSTITRTGTEHWWTTFTPYPYVREQWRDPEYLDIAKREHDFFLAMQGIHIDDPAVVKQAAQMSDNVFEKFADAYNQSEKSSSLAKNIVDKPHDATDLTQANDTFSNGDDKHA